ncbi:MAG: type II secretion system F family protein [Candidatus Omnitrophica bacterium]|nr:type II secretion system F family protein [Candidatus Omnitrophota bacterium]MBU1869384.1 type II secretion system F family protein [Candidatus Omnitrophota bacterium]
MLLKLLVFIFSMISVAAIIYSLYPLFESRAKKWQVKRVAKMAPSLDRMFLDVSMKKLMILDTLSPIVCGIIAYVVTSQIIFALGAAFIGLLLPVIVIKQLERGRRKKFSAQLVDALMILSSSLKAGLSLFQAFEVLVEEMPAPMSQEFNLVARQVHMGIPIEEAMSDLKKRMKVEELDMVVTAMMVARETGGELPETFSRVAYTIQERNKLLGRVNALCVQGKLQGVIMSIIPVLFSIAVYKMDPHFFDIFFQDPMGKMLLGYAVISQLIGMVVIKHLSKIDI